MTFELRRAKMLGFVHAISFQDFQPMWSPPMLQTDGQTDDMRSQDRALHYSASCGKNQEGETYLDLLEQEIVSGSHISWATCKSAP